ncbi:ATP-binding protein [Kitasatospora cineracea]|uniref:Tetratricopeptide repeat protein n=1 Tax=Kitasatospora cineracea TaxID=88074 RepID=A0A3N4S6A9_9ACTN|nr:helix-turn-helix domain-containing protein [Kitasatospora cineracea]RPE31914.1 tetratricopeptide repeat protein [Kitasatospora cineracea]
MAVEFGELLRDLRLAAGWTQEELSDRSGVSVHSISMLEAGRRRPRLSSVARLADGLALPAGRREQLLAAATRPATDRPASPAPPSTSAPASAPAPASALPPMPVPAVRGPRQLPSDSRLFTGRTVEGEFLAGVARLAPEGTEAGMVVLCVITGMGGVGKTALVVRTAHRVGERFPDGQLFLDLRSHTAGLEPLSAEDALETLLRSLDVPADRIPSGLTDRAALYRARLSGTRTLVLLDNASSAAQVRPLLPGSTGCLVLVTSRSPLVGLDDAHLLTLDVLPEGDALDLLRRAAGAGPTPTTAPAAPAVGELADFAELARLGGRLPLALRILGARLRHRPRLTAAALVEELREERHRLGRLRDEDRDLAALFRASYRDLPPEEQRLLRLLGVLPGEDLEVCAAAHLLGADRRGAERLLESLLGHHLLAQPTPGRYRMHDLVRSWSRALAEEEPPARREIAGRRLLDHYQDTAERAGHRLARYRGHRPAPTGPAPRPAPDVDSPERARDWLRAERNNLLAAMARSGDPLRRSVITAALAPILELDGPRSEEAALHLAAAEAAAAQGRSLDRAEALWRAGRAHRLAGRFEESAELFDRAEQLYRELGDARGRTHSAWERGRLAYQSGDLARAVELYGRALAGYRELGDPQGEAHTLWDLGRARRMLGETDIAEELLAAALDAYRSLGDRAGEALALSDLAHLRYCRGRAADSGDLLERALAIARELGDRQSEANAAWLLGRIRLLQGAHPQARDLLDLALARCRELGIRQGEASTLSALGELHLATGRTAAAVELQREAAAVFRTTGNPHGEANALHGLALALRAAGDRTSATGLLHGALETFEADGDLQAQAEVLNSLGLLAADLGDLPAALDRHHRALELARRSDSPLDEARALLGIGHCLPPAEQPAALDAVRRGLTLLEAAGAAEAADARTRLALLTAAHPQAAAQP